jgi:hypothetical protein
VDGPAIYAPFGFAICVEIVPVCRTTRHLTLARRIVSNCLHLELDIIRRNRIEAGRDACCEAMLRYVPEYAPKTS